MIGNPLEQFTWLSRDHLNVLVYLVCSSAGVSHATIRSRLLVNRFPFDALRPIGESIEIRRQSSGTN